MLSIAVDTVVVERISETKNQNFFISQQLQDTVLVFKKTNS
jgi:hypothetical protein